MRRRSQLGLTLLASVLVLGGCVGKSKIQGATLVTIHSDATSVPDEVLAMVAELDLSSKRGELTTAFPPWILGRTLLRTEYWTDRPSEGDSNQTLDVRALDSGGVVLATGEVMFDPSTSAAATVELAVPHDDPDLATEEVDAGVSDDDMGDNDLAPGPDLLADPNLLKSVTFTLATGKIVTTIVDPGFNSSVATIGDFNGDKIPDIAIIDRVTMKAGLLIGKGDRKFDLTPLPDLIGLGLQVRAGDFDEDGLDDVAISELTEGTVHTTWVLLSSEAFLQRHHASDEGFDIEIADMDGDGHLDLLCSGGNSAVRIESGLGNGTFPYGGAFTFSTPSLNPVHDIAVADLDNDGQPDLVLAPLTSASFLQVAFNLTVTPGDVQLGHNELISGAAKTAAIGDYDGNKLLDVYAGGTSGHLLKNNGNGQLVSSAATPKPYFAVAADFNHDGFSDLVYLESSSTIVFNQPDPTTSALRVAMADGIGGFSSPVTYALAHAANQFAVADLDKDGFLDVIIPEGPSLEILFGKSDGTLDAATSGGGLPFVLGASDMDGDGKADIIAYDDSKKVVVVYPGPDQKNPVESTTLKFISGGSLGSTALVVRVFDYNGDGVVDLLEVPNNMSLVYRYRGNADHTFVADGSFMLPGPTASHVAVGNVDHQGWNDVLMGFGRGGSLPTGGLELFDATAMSYPTSPTNLAGTTATIPFVLFADLDKNTWDDLVEIGEDGKINVFMNDGAGKLTVPPVVYSYPFSAAKGRPRAAAGDFNGDGRLDLAVRGDHVLLIFLQDASGAFKPSGSYPTSAGTDVPWVVVADFNSDGHLDVESATTVFLGDGSGNLFTWGDLPLLAAPTGGTDPYALTYQADIDGNGRADLISSTGVILYSVIP